MSEPDKKIWYKITFKPAKTNNNVSPDSVTFSQVSHVCITIADTGEHCAIKQRGGQGARVKRYNTRISMNKNLLNGIENKDKEHPKEEKDKKEQEVAIKDEREEHKKIIEEFKNNKIKIKIKNKIIRAKLKSQAELRKVILDISSKKYEKGAIFRAKLESQAELRKVILDINSNKAEKVSLEIEPVKVDKKQEENIEIKETEEKENIDVEKNRADNENVYHYLESIGRLQEKDAEHISPIEMSKKAADLFPLDLTHQISEEKANKRQEETKNFLDNKNLEFGKKIKKTRVDLKRRNQIDQDTRKLEWCNSCELYVAKIHFCDTVGIWMNLDSYNLHLVIGRNEQDVKRTSRVEGSSYRVYNFTKRSQLREKLASMAYEELRFQRMEREEPETYEKLSSLEYVNEGNMKDSYDDNMKKQEGRKWWKKRKEEREKWKCYNKLYYPDKITEEVDDYDF